MSNGKTLPGELWSVSLLSYHPAVGKRRDSATVLLFIENETEGLLGCETYAEHQNNSMCVLLVWEVVIQFEQSFFHRRSSRHSEFT